MINGVNLRFNSNVDISSQTNTVSQNRNANNSDMSIFTQKENSEDSMVSSEFESDKIQLQEDWNYFKELEALLNSGDESVVKEINSIQAGTKVDATDENAIQYNANTDLLLSLQEKAATMSADTQQDKSSNPFI